MNEEKMEVIIEGKVEKRKINYRSLEEFRNLMSRNVPELREGETIMQMIDGTTHIVRLY